MIALLAIYVGAVYGGSYSSILINIPGTAASAATAIDGYPLACKGQGGRALGLTTTASWIGTMFGMVVLVSIAPLIVKLALQFTSFEFFLLAFFGILISGTLTSQDLVYKGWIAGLFGLFLATVGRDRLQFFSALYLRILGIGWRSGCRSRPDRSFWHPADHLGPERSSLSRRSQEISTRLAGIPYYCENMSPQFCVPP